MSKSEQDALLAYFNTFKLARRVNTFASLADGKVLMEVMSQIDASHFKGAPARAGGAGPSENWVLKMNSMKRLYRLLLSCPLPPPQPSLSLTSLPEPNFSSVVRSPTSPDGLAGLIQIARFCLSIGVWANGNEKVIKKIQGLDEKVMAELMRSIEEVMGTLPEEDGEEGKRISPIKVPVKESISSGSPPSLVGLREDRDRSSRDNDDLRDKLNTLQNELSDLGSNLESTKQERDDTLSRLTAAREASSTGLRSSQNASSEIDRLRADLAIAEDNYNRAEAALEQESSTVQALTMEVEELRVEAEEAAKLRDQLDEYRYTAERLQKTENVVEKYKKKLEESAGLRREFKADWQKLEEENLALIESKASLEAELRKSGGSKGLVDNTKVHLSALENRVTEQANEIIELQNQIEIARLQLEESTTAHERDKEELHLLQDRIKENELAGVRRNQSQSSLSLMGETSLEAELEDEDRSETKTDLKIKIRNLERQLGEMQLSSDGQLSATTLNKMLEESNRARDRYQADYIAIRSEVLKLQAQLEFIRSGKAGDGAQSAVALRQEIEEIMKARDQLSTSNKKDQTRLRELEKDLSKALTNLDSVGKDELTQIEHLRDSVSVENAQLESRLASLEGELVDLKEKDRLHLEETKRLLMEKIHLQENAPRDSENIAATQDDAQIKSLQLELQSTKDQLATLEKRYANESRLMLSAWQDLGSRTSRDHLIHALSNSTKRSAPKSIPQGWLGKQRRYQEDAVYARS